MRRSSGVMLTIAAFVTGVTITSRLPTDVPENFEYRRKIDWTIPIEDNE
jgi:hypothetical protein